MGAHGTGPGLEQLNSDVHGPGLARLDVRGECSRGVIL